jgi:iron complex outermembrane recepter protein
MRRILSILFLFFISLGVFLPQQTNAQQDTSKIILDEFVITATRTLRNITDIPAQVDVITSDEIDNLPVLNIDDVLKLSTNVSVNRSWGIFSKNAAVTMRGLESSARTLILVDDVPKNKIAGGSVNWHNINPDIVDRIEIIKGPASALYGNNAMGGVINIITKRPTEKFSGSLKSYYGTYNTFGNSINLMGSNIKEHKGFYWNLNGFYRQGDGYIFEPPEFLDETDVMTYLSEYGGGSKLGYQFNENNYIELVYDFYDETRGSGRKVHEEDGSYESYLTNQLRLKYAGKIKQADFKVVAYFTREDYNAQKESLNDYDEYRLYDSETDKTDKGLWFIYSTKIKKTNLVTIGAEVKMGDVVGNEIYRTSPDLINFNSKMNIYGLFIQDEANFLKEKLKLIAGIRCDVASFYDGFQSVIEPTKTTGFTESFSENLPKDEWIAFSPKLSLQYSLSKNAKVYISYGVGFKPPKLKDLSQTGKIRKGFRIANPNLKPETLTNYEIGYSQSLCDKIKFNTAIYYSMGNDFQTLVGNGDSIDTGGSDLKPILQTENIAQVRIIGTEFSVQYFMSKNLWFHIGYSYNDSKIIDCGVSSVNPDLDLSGKYMIEVSPHLFFATVNWKNKYFNTNISCNFVDEQWYDDENTILIEDYFLANIKLSKTFKEKYNVFVDIQNVLDNEFVDRKGRLSPGRMIMGGFKYSF